MIPENELKEMRNLAGSGTRLSPCCSGSVHLLQPFDAGKVQSLSHFCSRLDSFPVTVQMYASLLL